MKFLHPIFLLLFLGNSKPCISQIVRLNDTIQYIKDLNSDKINDTLSIFIDLRYESSIEYYSSVSGNSYNINSGNSPSLGSFLDITPIPDELFQPKSYHLIDSISKYLTIKNKLIDPSFNWLLNAYEKQNFNLNDSLFSLTVMSSLDYDSQTEITPKHSSKLISKDTLPNLWANFVRNQDSIYSQGFVNYYGSNHKSSIKDTSTKEIEVFRTAHGVYIKQKGKYKWLFTSDELLFDGPEKLRWKSIDKVKLHKDFLIVHHRTTLKQKHKIFIINLKSGKIGELNLMQDSKWYPQHKCFNFHIDDNNLILYHSVDRRCSENQSLLKKSIFNLELLKTKLE